MHTTWPGLSLSIGIVSTMAVSSAAGAGLGAAVSAAVLGQPLDYAVQVRLDPGEALPTTCVAAEVTAGERRIPPGLVRTVVEMTGAEAARVRVITLVSIDEPVIGIQLTMGCTARISRRYVVMVDPPLNAVTAPAHAATPAKVPDTAVAAAPAAAAQTVAATSVSAPPPASRAPASRAPAPSAAALERQAQRRAERRAAQREARAKATVAARAPTPVAAEARAPARLKLDPVEPSVSSVEAAAVEAALQAVAQASSAARAHAAAASAAAERIAALERSVQEMRAESKASRDLAAQFRQRLAATEGSSAWLLPLAVVAVMLAALAAWLAWRLGRVQAERQHNWREVAAVRPPEATVAEPTPSRQPTAPIPFVTSEVSKGPARPVGPRARSAPAWPPPAPPVAWPRPDSLPPEVPAPTEPEMQRTTPVTPSAHHDEGAPRDVSIEELIDLEQQAEFFVVLGQDDAAIELLAEHLRSTGGGSPLPYLKLLEIQQRRGDRQAYEHLRARFNQRFNAYAPEWGVDLGHGKTLDDYPGVIPRLQQVWAQPLDTMAELEALLFRKSRGELFDLPAYREVLFLYSLARDLLDRSAGDTGDVDLLLPMADAGEFKDAAPSRHAGLERDAFRDTLTHDERPTGPVDFDVSAAERPTSIFDLLGDTPRPPRRSA